MPVRITVWNLSTANNGGSLVNYHQSSVFDRPYLSCNDHRDRWVFQEIFFIITLEKFF